MFSLINMLNCLPPLLCSVWSQARMYEINYIDQQFFIVTKPQDKNSLNWPVGSGHSRLGLQTDTFLSFLKKLNALTTGMEGGLGGGMQIKWAIYLYIDIINQYHAHRLSSFIALLISFARYFKIVINYFQFVNFTHFFQPSYSPLEDPANWIFIGLLTKCSIELPCLILKLSYFKCDQFWITPSDPLKSQLAPLVCMRLTILTSSFLLSPNHKIKIA